VNKPAWGKRGALVRVLVWSGILVAAAVFWISVALGLAAWIR
jgi:hypothetical protein